MIAGLMSALKSSNCIDDEGRDLNIFSKNFVVDEINHGKIHEIDKDKDYQIDSDRDDETDIDTDDGKMIEAFFENENDDSEGQIIELSIPNLEICAMPVKKKTLSLQERLEILEKIKNRENLPDLADKYGVHISTISRLKTSEQLILYRERVLKSCDGNLCKKRFKIKAKHFNELLNGSDNLKFSTGWVDKFKKRHGIRCISMHGEKLSADTTAAEVFKKNLQSITSISGLPLDKIYNCDETGLFLKIMPKRTLASKSEKSASNRKLAKTRSTIMMCSNASGTHKLPLFVIGKSKSPRCFKNIKELPVIYKDQAKAWMNQDLMREWFIDLFLPQVKETHNIDTNKRTNEEVDDMLKSFDLRQCISFCESAWNQLTSRGIRNCWKKLIPLENNAVSSDVECIDLNIFHNLISNTPGFAGVSLEDVNEWIDADNEEVEWAVLSDKEIVKDVLINNSENVDSDTTQERDHTENFSDEDDSLKISIQDAYKATNILLNYYPNDDSQLSQHLLPVLQVCYEDLTQKSLSVQL
ncbi:tigger transposable element-derived protein 4-like [Chelonus insularis]|uniref:tigger transposable element-derived protein 4-like n=1 Tax=Chelonus insularis TaxID=460826 RepID=UPI00158AFF78|nr:tigger transposable element-derived protein 4-like [Chelonus insularis]